MKVTIKYKLSIKNNGLLNDCIIVIFIYKEYIYKKYKIYKIKNI